MPSVREASPQRPSKRLKVDDESTVDAKAETLFAKDLLDDESIARHALLYQESLPYHHSVIPRLFRDDLLRSVRKEIKDNLVFTEKETDIYKVNQTGDLANLDGLVGDELSKLKSLSRLRNALYSEQFRSFLRNVTGVGPLSGKKIDMSINNYTQGCHLLNHDDVIGTRSISYILYLPDPDESWKVEYGGALELYPVREKGIPFDEPSVSLPPSWNQFIMFAVQPGHSFHSVEEVVEPGRERLSISGWFHIAQEGEEGYRPDANAAEKAGEEKAKSTLEQLLSTEDEAFDDYSDEFAETEDLSEEEKGSLGKLIDDRYLDLRTLVQINDKFCEESQIQITDVLRRDVADKLQRILTNADSRDDIKAHRMTRHGTGVGEGWRIQGPPHRQRFLTLDHSTSEDETSKVLRELQDCLRSNAFRKWLSIATSLEPLARKSTVRRFRPGLDYTLATSNQKTVIEVDMCLTPSSDVWDEGEAGGYSCFMAPHEDEDAAVYKSSTAEEEDGVLLTSHAGWNKMTIVMRDPGVLAFTKYVAVKAGASRWDCLGEYTVSSAEVDETED